MDCASYWLSKAGSAFTLMPTMLPKICGVGFVAEEIGILSSDCMLSILYCGACTATLYSYPFNGFTQKDGETVELELSVSNTLLATSVGLRPTDCTRVRSTFRKIAGKERNCCTCTSTAPGMC